MQLDEFCLKNNKVNDCRCIINICGGQDKQENKVINIDVILPVTFV